MTPANSSAVKIETLARSTVWYLHAHSINSEIRASVDNQARPFSLQLFITSLHSVNKLEVGHSSKLCAQGHNKS